MALSRATDTDCCTDNWPNFFEKICGFVSDIIMHCDAILIISEINIYFSNDCDTLLVVTFSFTQFCVNRHSAVVTHDLIPSCRIVVSDLTVSPITSVMSDHFHIKFEVTTCPPSGSANAFSTQHFSVNLN